MAGLDTDTSTSTTSNIHGSMAHASRRARRWRCTCRRSANCKGKSKFVLEHQAMWEKEGRNKGYDTTVHRWRFATVPEGKILAGWEKSDILPLHSQPMPNGCFAIFTVTSVTYYSAEDFLVADDAPSLQHLGCDGRGLAVLVCLTDDELKVQDKVYYDGLLESRWAEDTGSSYAPRTAAVASSVTGRRHDQRGQRHDGGDEEHSGGKINHFCACGYLDAGSKSNGRRRRRRCEPDAAVVFAPPLGYRPRQQLHFRRQASCGPAWPRVGAALARGGGPEQDEDGGGPGGDSSGRRWRSEVLTIVVAKQQWRAGGARAGDVAARGGSGQAWRRLGAAAER
ncbi:hypothetical protein OsJ_18750 [Oryza sativa Japonica Group]|uniref:Uncharacterized protein n=1 Tax=Oryza sativa subsp. japonica TaxID=39947 RepID=B9FPW6_ORYSJ|nr:hypothetical protein OsJ_18750 [Oryza sativa Japonica Group]